MDWEYKVNECVVVPHYMFFSGLRWLLTRNIKLTSVLLLYITCFSVDWEYKVNECVVVIHYMFFSGLRWLLTGNIKLTSGMFCYTLHVFQWTAVVVDWEYKVNKCVVVITHYMFFSGLRWLLLWFATDSLASV